mmetsp:Transcript_19792/g.32468  ORF Transcript_19792/g.32468 Transcript_19792/m.32468 type:complete len:953 (+) Transcript_19792:72-2930(+)
MATTTTTLSKTGTNSTTSSSVIEDFILTPADGTTSSNNINYNDDDDEETTTDDDESNNYNNINDISNDDDDDDDDTLSLSTAGSTLTDNDRQLLHKLTSEDTDDDDDDDNDDDLNNNDTNSTTTSTGGPSSGSYIEKLLTDEQIFHDYNDGDLQILNALVNKLHEADVSRRFMEEEQFQLAREEEARQHTTKTTTIRSNSNYRRASDYEVEDLDDEDLQDSCSEGYEDGTIRHHYQLNDNSCCSVSSQISATTTEVMEDLPSEMPLHPPSFSPLLIHTHNNNDNNNRREFQLSISSVDCSLHGPSIEIVPTSQISNILPQWNQSWKEEWEEWKLLYDESQRKRREGLRRSNSTVVGNDHHHHDNAAAVRRNRSAPDNNNNHNNNNNTTSSPRSFSTYHNRYGKPTPLKTKPNPIVTKSSKKIHRHHARYALTAGMMLGVRESVGGANGVECELEAKLWEESELLEETTNNGGSSLEGKKEQQNGTKEEEEEVWKQQQQICCLSLQQQQQQKIEMVLGPLKVSTVDPPTTQQRRQDDDDNNSNSNTSQQTTTQQQHQDAYLTTQCSRISKYKFAPQTFYLGSNTSEPLPHKYKFKVYAPVVFQRIRSAFGVEKQTFLHSVCGKFNLYEFASNAKSGQFFFYSHDGRYMIKTLTYTEQKFLRLILPTYYRHLTRHPHTFLTHFYGLYRVCMPNADNTRLHFVIMRSVFHTEKKIDRVWDLKGSTVGRKSNKGESVLKDLDILEEGKKLRFRNGSEREAFLKQLEIDAAFLATMGIMDYSLLLGLHNDCDDGCCSGVSSGGVDQVTPKQSEDKGLDSTGDSSPTVQGSSDPPLPMTNTPHRRNVLMRKTINGSSPSKPPSHPKGGRSFPMKSSTPLSSSSNPITSMSDLGIQGGTSLRPETYYCGIIDILQYYNARKMGETVIKKAAGGDADNISCVDPETYGKRFVKFISDLVE